jgi:hypothetical protein
VARGDNDRAQRELWSHLPRSDPRAGGGVQGRKPPPSGADGDGVTIANTDDGSNANGDDGPLPNSDVDGDTVAHTVVDAITNAISDTLTDAITNTVTDAVAQQNKHGRALADLHRHGSGNRNLDSDNCVYTYRGWCA